MKGARPPSRLSATERVYQLGRNFYGGFTKRVFRSGRALWPPLTVTILTTHRCNYRCSMCFLQQCGFPEGPVPGEMSTDELLRLLDQVPRISLCTFSGGELFMRGDILTILGRAAKTNKFNISTNGLLLRGDNAEAMLHLTAGNMFKNGLVLIGVSLMGDQATHDKVSNRQGSYQLVLENVRRFQEAKRNNRRKLPKIDLKTTISPANAATFGSLREAMETIRPDFLTLLIQSTIRYPCYHVRPLEQSDGHTFETDLNEYPDAVHIGDNPTVLRQIKDLQVEAYKMGITVRMYPIAPAHELVKHFDSDINTAYYDCVAPWTDLLITPYCQVVSCLSFGHSDLRKVSLRGAWNAPYLKDFRKAMIRQKVFKACRGCSCLEYRSKHFI